MDSTNGKSASETELIPDKVETQEVIETKIKEEITPQKIEIKDEPKIDEIDGNKNELKEEISDVYSYTKSGGFTSETHKIEIKNLPKHIGYDNLKKLLKKLELKPLKTKLIGKSGAPTHSFVTFRCDEDRDEAISKLNDYLWKNKNLIVRKANPIPDPLVEKRNELRNSEKRNTKRTKTEDKQLSDEELAQTLNDKISCFWKMPYNQQKQQKCDSINKFLLNLHKEIIRNSEMSSSEGSPQIKCLQLDDIRVSPVIDGYRNKCEFTVGIDKTVGFRLGLYREGTVRVITPALNCPIIGDRMRKALNAFQKYVLTESRLNGFDPETHSGHWIQSTVRTTAKDSMIIMCLHPQQLNEQELSEEKTKIIKFFENNTEFDVNSVYIHISSKRHEFSNQYLEHLFGQQYVFETIQMDTNIEFRISPLAFFQINTIGAQICFESIADLIKPNPELNLLDICCGTGTIGLCLASRVKKVIGIELNGDAISDAKFNAQSNDISNVQFIEGKAEEVINQAMDSCGYDSEIVAVIDPPRAGLNNSIIRVLRNNSLLKRLVYVSCDPNKAIKNMIDLCRPTSKTYKGIPFMPIRAIGIDLFPHTDRCELVLLFERITE